MSDSELERLRAAGVLGPLDVHFARVAARLDPAAPPEALLGAAFASRAIAHGHVCADLKRLAANPLLDDEGQPVDIRLPTPFSWVLALGGTSLCGDGQGVSPLVLDGQARLYLTRYHRYEQTLANHLRARASVTADVDLATLRSSLERLFPAGSDERQRLAATAAVLRNLTVVSGGPGTGKTTTVVRVLALLLEQARSRGEPWPRIHLLAPTGKAAARLAESVVAGASRLDCDPEVVAAIPREASTIHRRLGYRPGHATRFFHDAENPLPADVVVVDEASMVDLALMAKLVEAIRPGARLILLGDKDQLASVEAGAILGDICDTGRVREVSKSFAATLRELGSAPVAVATGEQPAIGDCVFELARSYRFGDDSAVGNLARAIGTGRGEDALALLANDAEPNVAMMELRDATELPSVLARAVVPRFAELLRARTPQQRLAALGEYRLLAAHRRGPFGSERLNALIEELLPGARTQGPSGTFYDGRPILITKNDYQLQLFNGDVGVVAREPSGELRAWFPGNDGELRSLSTARLPPCESCFAMTVHKSQGSEFDDVGLVMPPQVSPILTRELLYTGVTRARNTVHLFGMPGVLGQAALRRVERASGLRAALWGEG